MKSKLLTLVVLGLATASQAATYDVYITGSTAGRSSVHTAIGNILSGETVTQDNAALGSANRANFTGGTFGGDTYNVYCSWSGSAEGVQSLVEDNDVAFMVETDGLVHTSPTTFNAKANIAFSDVFQSSTVFTSLPLNDSSTIVLPFKFFASEGSTITNVTPALAQYLYLVGNMPLAMLTGNPADQNAQVYATGRNNGSGTRITTMAETGVGAISSVVQYKPTLAFSNVAITGATTTASSTTVTHSGAVTVSVGQPIRGTGIPAGALVASVVSGTQFTLDAAATASGTPGDIRGGHLVTGHTNVGDGGESSGSTVASNVAASTNGLTIEGKSPIYYLGYVGLSDGNTAILNGAKECLYNGMTYSATAVREGQYSLWGYLHLLTRPDVTTGPSNMAAQIVTQLDTLPGSSGLALSTMNVVRLADGGTIFNTY